MLKHHSQRCADTDISATTSAGNGHMSAAVQLQAYVSTCRIAFSCVCGVRKACRHVDTSLVIHYPHTYNTTQRKCAL